MKINEIRLKTEAELEKMLLEMKEKLRGLHFKVVRRELKNIREIREIKKDIARILTILKGFKKP